MEPCISPQKAPGLFYSSSLELRFGAPSSLRGLPLGCFPNIAQEGREALPLLPAEALLRRWLQSPCRTCPAVKPQLCLDLSFHLNCVQTHDRET